MCTSGEGSDELTGHLAGVSDLDIELQPVPEPGPVWRVRPAEPQCAVQRQGDGAPQEPEVYLDVRAVEVILISASQHPDVETGGLLVGEWCQDEAGHYVRVTEALPAHRAIATRTSLTFTHEAWNQMLEEHERRRPDQRVIGWYHTHPGLGVYLSEADQFIHEHYFGRPQEIALVVDPQRRGWGVFCWRGDCLEPAGRLFVYGEGANDGAQLAKVLAGWRR